MDADGGNARWLIPDGAHGDNPAWSADGAWLAFHGTDGAIYAVRPDGSHLVPLTRDLGSYDPAWAP